MPTICRRAGWRFHFYAGDHPPTHVHVEKDGAAARFELQAARLTRNVTGRGREKAMTTSRFLAKRRYATVAVVTFACSTLLPGCSPEFVIENSYLIDKSQDPSCPMLFAGLISCHRTMKSSIAPTKVKAYELPMGSFAGGATCGLDLCVEREGRKFSLVFPLSQNPLDLGIHQITIRSFTDHHAFIVARNRASTCFVSQDILLRHSFVKLLCTESARTVR